ncbi:MAG: DNA repair protein RadC [Chloroflexi bacterium]|nr:DNA repair protein RadC [Chloroflexota bacterium]
MKELPSTERPRERLQHYGPAALSTVELLAIILRVGQRGENVMLMAQRLLSRYGGLPGLARASFAELCRERGLSTAKVAQLKAALELGRRLLVAAPEERLQVRSPGDVADLLMAEMGLLEQEEMWVLLLDTRYRLKEMVKLYVGSLNASTVRVAELFRDAVRANCAAILVVHNHPSGDPTPSPEDVRVTEMLAQAGRLLDIDVLDHLIVAQGRFVSLKERGLGFS